jgi:hypothetical protein
LQGGQTQGTDANNVFPVDHVTSLLLDGKCINIINLWRKHEISAGDDLILILKKIRPNAYNLSRDTNTANWQVFGDLPTNATSAVNFGTENLQMRKDAGVWQLVPFVHDWADDGNDDWLGKLLPSDGEYDYRVNGYWHIARALQMAGRDPHEMGDTYSDATRYRRTGELMEVTFQPVFVEGMPDGSNFPEFRKNAMNDQRHLEMQMQRVVNPSLLYGGVGPSDSAWDKYLEQAQKEYAQEQDMGSSRMRGLFSVGSAIGSSSIGGRKRSFAQSMQQNMAASSFAQGGAYMPSLGAWAEEENADADLNIQGGSGSELLDVALESISNDASTSSDSNTMSPVSSKQTAAASSSASQSKKRSKKASSGSAGGEAVGGEAVGSGSLGASGGNGHGSAGGSASGMPSLMGTFIANSAPVLGGAEANDNVQSSKGKGSSSSGNGSSGNGSSGNGSSGNGSSGNGSSVFRASLLSTVHAPSPASETGSEKKQ